MPREKPMAALITSDLGGASFASLLSFASVLLSFESLLSLSSLASAPGFGAVIHVLGNAYTKSAQFVRAKEPEENKRTICPALSANPHWIHVLANIPLHVDP